MAAPQQVILPEVHLDSPIVLNKLLYFSKLAGLPLPDDYSHDEPFTDIDWARIRREENRLSDRLLEARKALISWLNSKQIRLDKTNQSSSGYNGVQVLFWPKCMTMLHTTILHDFLGRFSDAHNLINAACANLAEPINTVLLNVSQKLTGSSNLFSHNSAACSLESSHNRPPSILGLSQTVLSSPWTDQYEFWFLLRHQMRSLIMQNNSNSTTRLVIELNERTKICIITPEIIILGNLEERAVTYCTFEMMLMICDMYEGRLNVISISGLSCYLNPLKSRLQSLFDLVDELCTILGNSVYAVVANLESLVYAQLQLLDPVADIKGEFFSFICSELVSALQSGNFFSNQEATVITSKLLQCYQGLTPDLTAELLCVMRLWGHPMLTSKSAAKKVRESMCAPKLIDLQTTLKTLAFFNAIVINGFRRKHNGIWPKCILPPFASLSLIELKHDNSELSYQYVLNHWKELAMLEFEKSFDADPGADLSIFMKDKAISCPKADWLSVFRKSLIKPLCEKLKIPLPQSFNRRLLLNFLSDHSFDPEKELEYVTTGQYLDDDTFCASYSLKEKEIKETGRIFAKLTKKMRSVQVISESLLASHAGKLFKENGVVQDQLSLTKSLLTMSQIGLISQRSRRSVRENVTLVTHVTSSGGNIKSMSPNPTPGTLKDIDETTEIAACFLTTDLSKYCLNWRYQSIVMFATSMNKLYGYNHLFEWIHLRLMRSTLYVGDPFNPPQKLDTGDLDDVLNDDIFIVSPRGGIEGLCQKLWTMISISVIILSATESNTRVMSMVQGDNQTMAITTKVPRSLDHKQKKEIAFNHSKLFIERLRANNFGMGHHLKEQETIVSSDFFVYSKRIFWRGRILNQALKNVSKLCLIADVLSECTQTSCSNLTTTVMRLTENGVEKDVCYYLSIFLSLKQLVFDLLFPINKTFEDTTTETYLNHPLLLSRIAILPSQLGGLNYYSTSRLFNRNVGDPLVSAISDLKRFIDAKALPSWILKNVAARKPGKGTWSTLAADAYAINIDYLYPPTTYLKKHTQRVLMEGSVNPMLRGVFNDNSIQEEDNLAKFLLDRPVVMPRVAHIIIDQSSCGRRKQIQGYLDTTRTIIRHALQNSPLSIKKANRIIDYNTLYLAYNLEILAAPNKGESIKLKGRELLDLCSIDIARVVRRLSWLPLLSGRSIDGLETPDPIELVRGTLIEGPRSCVSCLEGDSKFTWLFTPGNITLDAPPEENPPIRVPYVGSKTDERRVASLGYIKGASSATRAALRLAGVYIWAFGDTDQNWEEALALANTRIDIDIEHLRALTPLPTSANLTHRLDDGLTQLKFTPASSYAYSSYVHISNDNQNLEILERIQDSNIIYQQLMLLGLGIIETWLQLPIDRNPSDISIHLHTGSSCCIRAVDSCIINESLHPMPSIYVPTYNKFVFDKHPLNEDQLLQIDNLTFQANISAIDMIEPTERVRLLAHFVGIQFAHSLTGLDETTSLINDAIVETDYSNNWISECLNTYLDRVFYFAAWNILLELAYQMYYLRIVGVESILDYLHLVLTRIPGLALTGIASTISHPRILRRLINLEIVLPSNSPYLATLDYHKLTHDAILWGARHVAADLRQGVDLEVVIPSEDSTEISDRVLNLIARKLSLMALILTQSTSLPHVRGLTPEHKCKMLSDFLVQNITNSIIDQTTAQMITNAIHSPKISAFPSNLYYLTRKVLNFIRQSDELQMLLSAFYDSFGFLEAQQNVGLLYLSRDIDHQSDTLTIFDFHRSIIDDQRQGERYQYPQEVGDSLYKPSPVVQPPTHHVLRCVGLSSTSWYKGLSVLNVLLSKKIPVGNHLYLAEGSGALMTLFEAYLPGVKIYYNSYFSSGQNPPQRNFAPLPTQFMESVIAQNINNETPTEQGFIQEFVPLWSGCSDQTDLSKKECVDFILQSVLPSSISLISVDLEEGFTANRNCLSKALINSLLISHITMIEGGILIIKVNLTPFSKFSRIVTLLHDRFSQIELCRSIYSDPNSDEIYLIATNSHSMDIMDFNHSLDSAERMDHESFTLISPQTLKDIQEGIADTQKHASSFIDIQIKTCQCSDAVDDHILLSRLGCRTQTNKIIDIAGSSSFADYMDRLTAVLTLYFKELISICESASLDRMQLIFTSYNVHFKGKISTNAKNSARHILDLTIRNWALLPVSLRHKISQALELGIFRVCDVISASQFLKRSSVTKFLIKSLGQPQIDQEFSTSLAITLNRPEQKRIWKALGSVILLETLEQDTPNYPQNDVDLDLEFDIAGDEI
ncbi:polymerase [Achimota virus 2]|uniref:RNA-directed RNA polymerase L n=1 Tax=Achimota virus 2 TaxID=1261101 RepID=K7X4N2_9MONO|nr:polymerase [Achimota virus 2]AFX75118.1 polymerase [Achimota virus 2]